MNREIKLPELGDGIESGDVLEVLVKEGEWIGKDQGIVELETDKATVEVPCTHAGRITKVHVSAGQTIPIGAPLITVDEQTADTSSAPGQAAAEVKPTGPARTVQEKPPSAAPNPSAGVARVEKGVEPDRAEKTHGEHPVVAAAQPPKRDAPDDALIAAGPAVRRFAREVGVELRNVAGSGLGGRITREDVLAVVRKAARGAREAAAGEEGSDADEWGRIRVEKMSKIRATIAKKMHESWTNVPRVTNYDDADITELDRIRQASKEDYAARGIKLTVMPFVVKAIAMALKAHPIVNASVDMEQGHVIYRQYINIGIAVDTDRGLVVPSLRNADHLSISEIARQLAELADSARQGKFQVADLRGSTFTISNLGAVGGTYSTPIINTPEVAVLLVGRARKLPVVILDKIEARLMMPLSLSYDHRLIDGAAATRFLNEVIGYLTTPSRLLLAP